MSHRQVGGVPADLATIARDVGSLLTMRAGLVLVSVPLALGFGEWHPAVGFLVAAVLTGGVGLSARRAFADAPAPVMKQGVVIAAAGWLCTVLYGLDPTPS
ncbi:MAG: hypothetical protein ABEJ23_05410 [Haloarculaceae archaeon]